MSLAEEYDQLDADVSAALAAVEPAAPADAGPVLPERLRPFVPDPEPGPVLLSNGWWAHRKKRAWWSVSESADDPNPAWTPFCGSTLASCRKWARERPNG